MPPYKNKFNEPDHVEVEIVNAEDGTKVGEIRLKPSSVLWKPKGKQSYYKVSLEDFAKWMVEKGSEVKQ